jgi:hypothetical protein
MNRPENLRIVLIRTAQGHREVLSRTLTLNADERSLLLRVNGHTPLQYLHQLGPLKDPGVASRALLNLGLIEVLKEPQHEAARGRIAIDRRKRSPST